LPPRRTREKKDLKFLGFGNYPLFYPGKEGRRLVKKERRKKPRREKKLGDSSLEKSPGREADEKAQSSFIKFSEEKKRSTENSKKKGPTWDAISDPGHRRAATERGG